MYDFRERRALLLYPNEQNRMLLEYAMLMGRIDYESVETGKDALTMWEPGAFAFVMLNLDTTGADVFEIAHYIRSLDQDIAVLVFSINDDPMTISSAIAAGCDLFLTMPFQLDLLLTLMKVLDAQNVRALPKVLMVDDRSRPHWEPRPAYA